MKYFRCDRPFVLFACLLVVIAALPAVAASEARITPLEIVRKLSAAASAQNQLSLEMFIDGALLFSGIREEELPALRMEILELTAAARRALGGITEQERLAEEILLYLHRHVLLAYRERQTRLDVLIREGSFNCVSSAVLYAVLAKAFSLPVAGVRTPDHAFCRITAGERAIDVETTSPFGFDPGSRREFKDHFGRVTGYTYVPPQNGGNRRLTGESGLLALILYNRSAFSSESGDYVQALAPAVDAYSLLGDAESRERLLVAVSNLASYYGLERRYAEGTSFLRAAVERFGPAPALDRLQADLVYNWAIELIDGGDIPGGLSLLERAWAAGELEEASWRRLFVYAYQKQALAASRQNYGQAAEIILEAIQQAGREGELLRSFEVYAHNQATELIAADDYPAARRVLLEALRVIPGSSLLAGDIRKLDTFTGRP